MGKFINEFKEFAVKGNAVDMAVGVIIGSAFGKIISSIVNDIIMPPIGWLIGGVNFRDLNGNFLQTTFDFIIIALCVFMLIKGINKMARKKKEEEKKEETVAAPTPTKEELLLTEIRDLLKANKA